MRSVFATLAAASRFARCSGVRDGRGRLASGAPAMSSHRRASPASSSVPTDPPLPHDPRIKSGEGRVREGWPPTLFTIPVLRYMKTYGLTHEQLAMVSVVQREWAAKNPRATFKTPITIEDVLNSRMIAYPFRLLQCCLVTDGGGALILVSAERAKDFPQKPVYLLGTGESVETPMVSQMEDFTSSRAF